VAASSWTWPSRIPASSGHWSAWRRPISNHPGTTRLGYTDRTCTAARSARPSSLGWSRRGGPEARRRETLWHYKQGGPGVFKGDLYFYRVDGDLRQQVGSIDTGLCPLFLLTGEYDFSCSPEDTLRTAAAIAGADVQIMERLGHFPMSENPDQFRGYILPVLEKIRTL
jgi:pimeloyl-ACP methyl ester carboxylesterase